MMGRQSQAFHTGKREPDVFRSLSAYPDREALEATVRRAVAEEAFEVFYQPLMDAGTMRCAGFEALLRLPVSNGHHIPPLAFIPVAEALGLINDLGRWVLEMATQTAAGWPAPLFVSVNLSAKQFDDGKLALLLL